MRFDVPEPVRDICTSLTKAGFEAYLVGGCVRDTLRGVLPKDWDVATNASPEQIQEIFPESVYENTFGTVGVKTGADESTLRIVEVTTYRVDGAYTDGRHPDTVTFASRIEEDLSRRDFTVNAIAYADGEYVDPYGGRDDLAAGIIRAVGDAQQRFEEDALRLMRAVRFATELGFEIELNTRRAIEATAGLLARVSHERIRDELIKLLMTPRAADGIVLLEQVNLLVHVLPELREGIGVGQNKHHIFTVFEHNVKALEYSAQQGYSLLVRMASLLHDVGKPKVKRGEGYNSTFYNHEVVGGRMTLKILDRLHFPKEFVSACAHLVRQHLFYYNVDEVSEAGVRRFVRRVGVEAIDDLLKVREADRIGSGVPKAITYKLRHLLFMIDKVKSDPISPKMLAINGTQLMELLDIGPGPHLGQLLVILLEEVIDDPKRNTFDYLAERARALHALTPAERIALTRAAKARAHEYEEGVVNAMKRQHHVR